MKTLSERVAQMGMNEDETVYRLTVGDAMVIVQDNTTAEQLAAISDAQLATLLVRVSNGFAHIDWMEVGRAAFDLYSADCGIPDEEVIFTHTLHVPAAWANCSENEVEDGDDK